MNTDGVNEDSSNDDDPEGQMKGKGLYHIQFIAKHHIHFKDAGRRKNSSSNWD